jgi:bacterioferritin (cytochrome b1)
MAITIEQLVELFNHDLDLEYSAAIQYINHSAVMTGAAYGDIIKNTHKPGNTACDVIVRSSGLLS